MLHTSESLAQALSDIPRSRMIEQLYLSGFKKNDCDYGKLHLTWATDPISKDYYSVLNPCFSYEPKTLELLNVHPCWLVRDGALPLIDALMRDCFSGVQSTLLFNRRLQKILPEELQRRSLFYDLVSLSKSSHKRDKVLIYTLVNGAYSSPEYFKSVLEQARAKRKDLPESAFHILLLLRENQFYQVDSDITHPAIAFPKAVRQTIPGARLITEREFDRLDDFSDYEIVDAQENVMIVGDSFLNHHLLSLNGKFLFEQKELKGCTYFEQSPHHAYRVHKAEKNIVPSIFPEAQKIIAHMKANELKIKSYWVPPYSENPSFGCFYHWLKDELGND